jgi:hypothetical protein
MSGALRAHAWALRCMARCAKVTPDTTPQWLLPRSYFRQLLDGNRNYITTEYVNNPTPFFQNLSVMGNPAWGTPAESNIPADCSNAPWWEDYEQSVQGHIVEMGFDDWRPVYEWKIRNIVDRCNGTSGWNRAQAFPYKIALRETAQAPWVNDWAECWDLNVRMGVVADTGEDAIPAGDLSYPQQGASALAMAVGLGIPGAVEPYEWLKAELDRLSTVQSFVYHRWSIA